ncbi:MAG: sigma-70 family RNA polymerase sigma factor [Bacteroidota bacterium]
MHHSAKTITLPLRLADKTVTPVIRSMKQPYQALIERCIQQDTAAHQRLYELFAPKMMAVCYRYARNQAEAEDMLQEGFIKVFQNLKRYTFKGSLEGWIRRIMVNTAIDLLRKHKYFQKETDIEEADVEEFAEFSIDRLEMEYLLKIIQELPTGYRVVFNLYAIEGYSHKEIGQQLKISESTSRSQYTRARSMLKKRICADNQAFKSYLDAS